jgi:hypothetical protein
MKHIDRTTAWEVVGFVTGAALGFGINLAYGDEAGPWTWLVAIGTGIVLGLVGRFLALRSSGSRAG